MLRKAATDLSWLRSRGYAKDSSLKLVGDRYGLVARQRIAVARCACSDTELRHRREAQVSAKSVAGRALWIDGYNVLTSIEAALAGGVILAARDGTFRDMASMHGSYRKVSETRPALELLGKVLQAMGVVEVVWLLDRPVSNSGRLKAVMEELAAASCWPWRIELAGNPDDVLAESSDVVATADSGILDRCHGWFNLVRDTIVHHVPEAYVVDLSLVGV
jgi:hypothetical protein